MGISNLRFPDQRSPRRSDEQFVNDDTGNDFIGYYSGDNTTAANRPQLVVTYQ